MAKRRSPSSLVPLKPHSTTRSSSSTRAPAARGWLLTASLTTLLFVGACVVVAQHHLHVKVKQAAREPAFATGAPATAAAAAPAPKPQHQHQTEQLQVQVTLTRLEPEDAADTQQHTDRATATAPRSREQQQQQERSQSVKQAAAPPTKSRAQSAPEPPSDAQQSATQHTTAGQAGQQQPPPPGAPPKVALLFVAKDRLDNEAVWRAFFQSAAQLQLHVAAAAAKAALGNSKTTATDALNPGMQPHPDVGSFAPFVYPGYRVQHGLTPGADPAPPPPPPRPVVLAGVGSGGAAAGQPAVASTAQHNQQPQQAAGVDGTGVFPGAANAWEAAALRGAIHELTTEHDAALAASDSRVQQQQPQGPEPQQPWNVYKQLSTLRDALAVVAGQESSTGGAKNNTSSATRSQHLMQLGARVDEARCQAQLSNPSAGSVATHSGHPLFSVYVHTPAGVLLPRSSILSGCELAVRLNTTRGYAQHVLAEAEALLLAAALSDPLNTKFVLVSDTSIPLYTPQVIWSQLMYEPLSRLDACITPGKDTQLSSRWRSVMATKHFGPQHWRKSSQWFTLSRAHAQLAVADVHVREMLHRYCYTNITRMYPICVSDEHWLPSLLASYALDSQTDCEGTTHYADWSAGGWHPKTFTASDLTPQLVVLMRSGIPSKVARLAAWRLNPAGGISASRGLLQAGAAAAQVPISNNTTQQPASQGYPTVLPGTSQQQQLQQQQQASAAAAAAAATARWKAAVAAQQARARVAAAAMAAAAAECDAAQAIATASTLIFNKRGSQKHTPHVQHPVLRRHLLQAAGSGAAAEQGRVEQAQALQMQAGIAAMGGEAGGTSGQAAPPQLHWLVAAGYRPLGQRCPLFARKFTNDTQAEVLSMALSCAGLGLGSWCAP